MSAPAPARLSLLALLSAVLGLLCATSPFAVFFGWIALRAINGSDGRLRGTGLALFGLVTGAIGVVALAVGSLAVAINTARERSNRAECQNNLGQIALAVNVYYDNTQGTFPPAALPPLGAPPEHRFSWLAGTLPYLGQRPGQASPWKPVADRLNFDLPADDPANRAAENVTVRRFLCPSHPGYDPRAGHGLTHYVGIAGVGPEAAALPATDPRAGFFGYDRLIKRDDVTAGAAQTLLATETTADNGPWAPGGPSTDRDVDPAETCYVGPGRAFGGCHRDRSVDVLTAAYADGSVRFVSAAINPQLFRAAARIAAPPGAN
jgi:hypothetical protein